MAESIFGDEGTLMSGVIDAVTEALLACPPAPLSSVDVRPVAGLLRGPGPRTRWAVPASLLPRPPGSSQAEAGGPAPHFQDVTARSHPCVQEPWREGNELVDGEGGLAASCPSPRRRAPSLVVTGPPGVRGRRAAASSAALPSVGMDVGAS